MTMFSDTRFRCAAHSLRSVDGTAAVRGGFGMLTDGRPSTRCSISWPTKTPAPTDYIDIVVRVTALPSLVVLERRECRLWHLDGLVGIPAGTSMEILSGNDPDPATMTMFAATSTQVLPNGRVGLWWGRNAGQGLTHEFFSFRIYNKLTSSPSVKPIAAGAVVQIGEVFASPVEEWPASDFEIRPVDLSLSNEASDGTIRRVKRTPQRQMTLTLSPQRHDRALTFYADETLHGLVYRLMSADYVAVVARPYAPGAIQSVTLDYLRTSAMLACLQDAGGLKFAAASRGVAPLTLTFKESL